MFDIYEHNDVHKKRTTPDAVVSFEAVFRRPKIKTDLYL